MTTERDLVIPELSFALNGTHRTHVLDDEAIRFRRVLESLLAAPFKVASSAKTLRKETNVETYKSCCGGGTKRKVGFKNMQCS